jgi:hypothetical protein
MRKTRSLKLIKAKSINNKNKGDAEVKKSRSKRERESVWDGIIRNNRVPGTVTYTCNPSYLGGGD